MTRIIALASIAVFSLFSISAFAGVAPTTGGSQMTQSGAKIAPPKPANEEKKENQEEVKEPAK